MTNRFSEKLLRLAAKTKAAANKSWARAKRFFGIQPRNQHPAAGLSNTDNGKIQESERLDRLRNPGNYRVR
jgi:hypothetical protein